MTAQLFRTAAATANALGWGVMTFASFRGEVKFIGTLAMMALALLLLSTLLQFIATHADE